MHGRWDAGRQPIYNDPEYEVELQGTGRVLGRDLAVFRPPGDRHTEVERVLLALRNCIIVETRLDL